MNKIERSDLIKLIQKQLDHSQEEEVDSFQLMGLTENLEILCLDLNKK